VVLVEYTFVSLGLVLLLGLSLKHKMLAIILSVAYVLRVTLVYYDVYVSDLPASGEDTLLFDYWATYWIIDSPTQIFENVYLGSRFYGWFVSLVYSAFDESRFVAQWCNALLACLAIRYFYLTARLLYAPRLARNLTFIFAFWPTYVLFSSVLLRESFIVFSLAAGIFFLVRWQFTSQPVDLVFTGLTFTLGAAMHSGVILALVALPVVVLYSGFGARNKQGGRRRNSRGGKGILVVLATIVMWVVLSSGIGLQKFSRSEDLTASSVVDIQRNSARDRTAYLGDVQGTSYFQLILQTPQRVIYFFLKPFPWDVQNFSDIIGLLDALLYFYLLVIIILRLKGRTFTRNEMLVLGIGVLIAFTFALATSNYGTAIRHRMKVLPVLALMAATPSALYRMQSENKPQRLRNR